MCSSSELPGPPCLLPYKHPSGGMPILPLSQGLMQRMSSDMAQLHVGGCPPTPPRGLLAPGEGGSAAAAAGAAEDATGMAQVPGMPQCCMPGTASCQCSAVELICLLAI